MNKEHQQMTFLDLLAQMEAPPAAAPRPPDSNAASDAAEALVTWRTPDGTIQQGIIMRDEGEFLYIRRKPKGREFEIDRVQRAWLIPNTKG